MNEQDKGLHQEVVNIDDLVQDDHNFNRGTDEGARLMERSFSEHGAGRSVFIDKNNRLVAGNKAQKGFKAAGYRRVVIVDSDPETLVAVRRKDIDLDSKEGREMALLDNLTTQVNLQWDQAELEIVSAEVEGFQPEEWGVEVVAAEVADGTGSTQKEPTNSELDVDGFGDKIKMVLEFSIEEHAFIQQRLTADGQTKEQTLLNLLGYAAEQ